MNHGRQGFRRSMRHARLVLLGVMVLSGFPASAQIGISLSLDRHRYLRYEPIYATVTVRNYAGNTLVFGLDKDSGRLWFQIEREDGRSVDPFRPDVNPASGLILGAGETKTLTLTLNTLYPLTDEGLYRVRVRISHPRLRHDYISDQVEIEIRDGIVIWKQRVGLPTSDPGQPIRYRDFQLLLFHADKGEVYCLRSRDDRCIYGVIRLGPRIAGVEPQCDVDAVSNVHVLFMIRPRLCAYRVYSPDLELRLDRYYMVEQTMPRLVRDPELGRVRVVGGRPAIPGVDFVLDKENRVTDTGEFRRLEDMRRRPPRPDFTRNEKEKSGGIRGFFRRLFGLGRK